VIFSEEGKDDMQHMVNYLPDNSEVKQLVMEQQVQLVIEQQVIEEQIDTSSKRREGSANPDDKGESKDKTSVFLDETSRVRLFESRSVEKICHPDSRADSTLTSNATQPIGRD
jgi:hypothetical protein